MVGCCVFRFSGYCSLRRFFSAVQSDATDWHDDRYWLTVQANFIRQQQPSFRGKVQRREQPERGRGTCDVPRRDAFLRLPDYRKSGVSLRSRKRGRLRTEQCPGRGRIHQCRRGAQPDAGRVPLRLAHHAALHAAAQQRDGGIGAQPAWDWLRECRRGVSSSAWAR